MFNQRRKYTYNGIYKYTHLYAHAKTFTCLIDTIFNLVHSINIELERSCKYCRTFKNNLSQNFNERSAKLFCIIDESLHHSIRYKTEQRLDDANISLTIYSFDNLDSLIYPALYQCEFLKRSRIPIREECISHKMQAALVLVCTITSIHSLYTTGCNGSSVALRSTK